MVETIDDQALDGTLLVTLDTGVLDEQYDELRRAADLLPVVVDFATVGLADYERGEHESRPDGIPTIFETAVLGEWRLGFATLGSEEQATRFEQIKKIISSGSIKQIDAAAYSGSGTQRQVRDATIFETHVRERRHVFVTVDAKGFISYGKREQLEALCSTRIMLPAEFVEWCEERGNETEKNLDRLFDDA